MNQYIDKILQIWREYGEILCRSTTFLFRNSRYMGQVQTREQ